MEKIGIDLHQKQSHLCTLTEDGEIVHRCIRTDRDRLAAEFGGRPRARILLEASTESEWVARCLEELGHEVVVGDPNFAPMYATLSRRVKTDRRDAEALMDACWKGNYRAAHRLSEAQRQARALLAVRDQLVGTRTRMIALTRALLRREGLRLARGQAESFVGRLGGVVMPSWLKEQLVPLVATLEALNPQIVITDRAIAAIVAGDPVVELLCSAPGVGPVTAVAFVATLDRAERFTQARQVPAYLGLVPQEDSSAERRHRGSITKAGNPRMRWLLVEAAWGVIRSRTPESEPLRRWALGIAGRRGPRVAAVAVARKLARILYAMWRDRVPFEVRSSPSCRAGKTTESHG